MSKKKLRQRIKELQAGNLALADINVSVGNDLKWLRVHHDRCIKNMACEIGELRLKIERLQRDNKVLDENFDDLIKDLEQAEKNEIANARFIAMVLRS